MSVISETEQPAAKVVEGSGGLLLEIDGKVVPNYDATIHPFQEGDVVTGQVVRIDNDEVLVDIGYKSEGVIPASELSIRKSVDPGDEVELGEEVDALVLTKEDQDGRLILSKKRARFERAWRRIEAAARVAGRHPSGAQPGRVHGPGDRMQGDRAQPPAQQRGAVPPGRP
jgi:small subunit ribosomal protein S1